ncbi:MAG: GNAT family N-acetyltransferase [Candidatus Paceibacterota bacterium]
MDENPFKNQEKLNTKVEIAKREDWEELKKLRLFAIKSKDGHFFGVTDKSVKEEETQSEEAWNKYFFDNNGFVAISRYGSEIVGMGMAFKNNDEENFWRMRSNYLKPEFRKMGLGLKMFATTLNEIRKSGGKKVSLNIEVGNKESMGIALKFGFKIINSKSVKLETGEEFKYDNLDLENLDDPEVIKKIDDVLNAG